MSNFNIDDILDGTLDDLADAPEFRPFPPGIHRCTLKVTRKLIQKHQAFEVTLTALNTEELTNPDDKPLEKGAETSVAYMMEHEKEMVWQLGQGKFKELLKSAAEHFGAKKTGELLEDIQNAEALVVTNVRANKDKTQSYTDIVTVKFV